VVEVGEVRGGDEDRDVALCALGVPGLHGVEHCLDVEPSHILTDHAHTLSATTDSPARSRRLERRINNGSEILYLGS
jgi:hypothetical protein